MSINIQECITCLTRYFPARLLCRTCSDNNFRAVDVAKARVENQTRLADGSTLATLRVGNDLRVIARVDPATRVDDQVELIDHANIAPGQAYVPKRELPQ